MFAIGAVDPDLARPVDRQGDRSPAHRLRRHQRPADHRDPGQWMPERPAAVGSAGLVAGGALARALDTQLGSDGARQGVRMLASFRAQDGALCRVFTATTTSGIACRDGNSWALRRTISGVTETGTYRQASSPTASLMADAQDLMAGDPLDAAAERKAVAQGGR